MRTKRLQSIQTRQCRSCAPRLVWHVVKKAGRLPIRMHTAMLVLLISTAPPAVAKAILTLHPHAPVELPSGSRVLPMPEMSIQGIPLSIQLFESPKTPNDVLQRIRSRLPHGLRLTQHDAHTVIQDAAGEPTWLLGMTQRGERTLGVLSRLALTRTSRVAGGSYPSLTNEKPHAPFSWLPNGLKLELNVHSFDGNRSSRQQIHTHSDLPVNLLEDQIFAKLKHENWRAETPPQAGFSVWKRGLEQLTITLVPYKNGSAMLTTSQTERQRNIHNVARNTR